MGKAPLAFVALLLSVSGLHAAPAAAVSRAPFITSEQAQLVDLTGGTLTIKPLLTTGDVVGDYQMSGIPDGIGWYQSSPSRIEVFMNHELALSDDDPSNSRISHLSLAEDGSVVGASYPLDGTEGFEELCSSTLETFPGGRHIYWTGEEAPHSSLKGSSLVLNADTEEHREAPWFGHMFHENIVPMRGLERAVLFVAEDGQAGRSQLYAYFADTFAQAARGKGNLFAWKPFGPTDGNPSPDDIEGGESLAGHFVRIPRADRLLPKALEEASQRTGAFDFIRIEDAVADPAHPGVAYFADTGAAQQEGLRGRIYRLNIDPDAPRNATLHVVVDGDAGDDMYNPDNLGISDQALVIQEDRNYAKSGYDRVLVYDLSDETLTPVARTDPRPIAIKRDGGPGAWESSGAVDASAFFGNGWWLLDVQATDIKVPVPGPSLEPNSAEGEGGQLLLVKIPGT
jgi:hypothetical protein